MIYKSFYSVFLRGAGLIGKFLLLFFMARYLREAEVGLYGLVVAAVGFSIYLLGFDFYSYSNREVAGVSGTDLTERIRYHITWLLVCYAVVLPSLYLLFIFEFIPEKIIIWFYLILVLEHITAEVCRFLIVREKQMLASVCIFLKTGLWPLICIAGMFLFENQRSLSFVLFCWLVGLLGSLALLALKSRIPKGIFNSLKIDWGWIGAGVKICFPILVATLSLRAVFTLDRYLLRITSDLSVVGVYVFYAGISAALTAFLEAGIFNFYYPRMIKMWSTGNVSGYRAALDRLKQVVFLASAVLAVLIVLFVNGVAPYIGRENYVNNMYVLYFCLLAVLILAWSMVYYYDLYCRREDKFVLRSRLSGLISFLVFFVIFRAANPLNGIMLSVCASSLVTLVVGWFYSVKSMKYSTEVGR